jgi:hypothetical protein
MIDRPKTQKVEATKITQGYRRDVSTLLQRIGKVIMIQEGALDRLSENINLNLHILGRNDALALVARLASASASVAPQVPFRSASSPAADVPWAAHLRWQTPQKRAPHYLLIHVTHVVHDTSLGTTRRRTHLTVYRSIYPVFHTLFISVSS